MIRRLASESGLRATILSMLFILFGLGSCAAGLAVTVIGSRLPSDLEVPLGDLSGFTVDEEGRVYCAVQFYGRLQQYDPAGTFLGGVHIPASSGAFNVAWDERSNRIVVATVRNRMVYELNGDLEIIASGMDPERYFEMENVRRSSVVRDNVVYSLSNFLLLYPRIVRTDSSGVSRTIVRSPLHLWLVMGPVPAVLYVVIGMALGIPFKQKGDA